ncbi:hypothetical protein NQZ68_032657 [Dissostichus eleginoides]|nr:hypothetical protein NQZ68_032657 [Dissostichus eleginoides]
MWAFLVITLVLAVRASDTNNNTEVEEQLDIARGKLLVTYPGSSRMSGQIHAGKFKDSDRLSDTKSHRPNTVPVKEMKAEEISSLLDSLGFYKRTQKGEEVPEEFQQFPLRPPKDEL